MIEKSVEGERRGKRGGSRKGKRQEKLDFRLYFHSKKGREGESKGRGNQPMYRWTSSDKFVENITKKYRITV